MFKLWHSGWSPRTFPLIALEFNVDKLSGFEWKTRQGQGFFLNFFWIIVWATGIFSFDIIAFLSTGFVKCPENVNSYLQWKPGAYRGFAHSGFIEYTYIENIQDKQEEYKKLIFLAVQELFSTKWLQWIISVLKNTIHTCKDKLKSFWAPYFKFYLQKIMYLRIERFLILAY